MNLIDFINHINMADEDKPGWFVAFKDVPEDVEERISGMTVLLVSGDTLLIPTELLDAVQSPELVMLVKEFAFQAIKF